MPGEKRGGITGKNPSGPIGPLRYAHQNAWRTEISGRRNTLPACLSEHLKDNQYGN